MSVCVRLNKETEELLDRTAKRLKATKSKVIKDSIRQYCEPILEKKSKSLYEFIKEHIDSLPSSGRSDLSVRHEELLYEMLQEKRRQGRL
jgi:predicted transcriptional regulator